MNIKIQDTIKFIRNLYDTQDFISLHSPKFFGNEKSYVLDCIDSTYVSSVGSYVNQFEQMIAEYTGAKYAIATVNGTAALHVALKLSGVQSDSEVITQSLSFVATSNAISYCGAKPIFIDVDKETLGLSPESLSSFLKNNTIKSQDGCINKRTNRKILAVLPMHTFGHPCRIDEILEICNEYQLALIEDSAESIGSYFNGKHTGTFGTFGIFSFNGNKTITTGGGGMIITNSEILAKKAKHLTTTSKKQHPYEFDHDEIGYNYRLPNINAALGCAQMESLNRILESKRSVAQRYNEFFSNKGLNFFVEPVNAKSNYWLNSIIMEDKKSRDIFLIELNKFGIMARPLWKLLNELDIYKNCESADLTNSKWLEDRIVNIPSSALL